MEAYVVTTIGVCMDTGVSVHKTYDEAKEEMMKEIAFHQMTDTEEMCKDCVKGYSPVAQCEVEVQIHKCGDGKKQAEIPVSKAVEGVLDDAYEFVCNELEDRGIPYDSSNTDKIYVNDTEAKKTYCLNVFADECLEYEGE